MMKIGCLSGDYANRRNIIGKVSGLEYVQIQDVNALTARVLSLVNRKLLDAHFFKTINLTYSYSGYLPNSADILHFFNIVSFGNTPWVTTFETILPRFEKTLSCHHGISCGYSSLASETNILKAIIALASKSCKNIIAMSQCNLNMQLDLIQQFPDYCQDIESKLICLHPPQKILLDNYNNKQTKLDGPIHFIFIGGAFFTKGGMEILETFCELKNVKKLDLKLTIVSSMVLDDYATKKSSSDVAAAMNVIRSNGDWIQYYESLCNDKVLDLMKSAHVGLLPTYADTYGYSVLELQASGCPVISTNVRALPEINNSNVGWIIEVPKNSLGEAIYTTQDSRDRMSLLIKAGLMAAIEEIMNNKEIIVQKANAALRRINLSHSPERYAEQLYEIYARSLQ